MLAIRLQRTGRKGHAQFRIIVQDAHRSPTSGNVVMRLGNYDPHTKAVTVDKEKSAFYLEHGAQPSPRVAYLLQKEGVKLPSWVKTENDRQSAIKNTDKLRRNRAEEPKPAETATEPETEATEPQSAIEPSSEAVEEVAIEEVTPEPIEDAPEDETSEIAESAEEVKVLEEPVKEADEPVSETNKTVETDSSEETPVPEAAEAETPADKA